MSIQDQKGWIFQGDWTDGFIGLLAYHRPPSVERADCHWMRIEEQVDGMMCGQLRANILPLPVPRARLVEILEATDWSGLTLEVRQGGWRHDLSWHNTPLDTPNDPTVLAYRSAIRAVGLTWTPQAAMGANDFGWRLAQAVSSIRRRKTGYRSGSREVSLTRSAGLSIPNSMSSSC